MILFNQQKTTTYILIGCVSVLWGVIFYRIYAVSDQHDPLVQLKTEKPTYFKLINHANDKVVLDLNYRDPFNGTIQITPIAASQNINPIKLQPNPKPQVNWANVNYTGYINNKSSKQKLAIIVVGGKEMMLTEGQNIDGVKLIKFAIDSILVNYQNQTKYIKLK